MLSRDLGYLPRKAAEMSLREIPQIARMLYGLRDKIGSHG